MEKCIICSGTDFYKDSGYFFCATCQTQSQDIKEEVLEVRVDNTIKLRKTRIHCPKLDRIDKELGWTSWELYNFVLIGLTNELIELGAPADIRVTVLQLWARYLGKLEVAFTSTKQKLVPKLSRKYKKRDAEIIYGKVYTNKNKQKSTGSSITSTKLSYQSEEDFSKEFKRNKRLMIAAHYERYVQLQSSSEGDALSGFNQSMQSSTAKSKNSGRIYFNKAAREDVRKVKNTRKKIPRNESSKYKKNYISRTYETGPELITPMKLWAILYLALRIHNSEIQLSDMLRYGREGHLSYYKLDHLIPPEISLTKKDLNFLSRATDITYKGMRRAIGNMTTFLGVRNIIRPNLLTLINRYCVNLALPRGISLYGERLAALSHPKMKFGKKIQIPNYEGRAMAFIIVILKMLFALDGLTEYEISNFADKVNSVISEKGIDTTRLFSFREWQRYIECRQTVLANTHFPTKLKCNSNIPVVDGLYIQFLESIHSKMNIERSEIITNRIPRELIYAMKRCIANVNDIDLPNNIDVFPPSLTPHHSYLHQLLEHPEYDLPNILRTDLYSSKVGYMTKKNFMNELAERYKIHVNFTDSNLHFVEKIVPFYEQEKMPSIKDLKTYIEVNDSVEEEVGAERKENIINYLHRKIRCQLKIDQKKRQHYDAAQSVNRNAKVPPLVSSTEFIFDETSSEGKLLISNGDDNKNFPNEDPQDTFPEDPKSLLSRFCGRYNISLSSTEEAAVVNNVHLRRKRRNLRGKDGRFLKQDNIFCEHSENITGNINEDRCTKEKVTPVNNFEMKDMLLDIPDTCTTNSMFSDSNQMEIELYDQNKSYDKTVETTNEYFQALNTKMDNTARLFRPFKDYWMYSCNFSLVQAKQFELLEKTLPRSFRWLLSECSSAIEMSPEELYEEVCLIEAYYVSLAEQSEGTCANINAKNPKQMHFDAILKEW